LSIFHSFVHFIRSISNEIACKINSRVGQQRTEVHLQRIVWFCLLR